MLDMGGFTVHDPRGADDLTARIQPYFARAGLNADAAALLGTLPAPAHASIIATERHVASFMNLQIAPGAGDPFHEAPILYPVLFSIPPEGEQDFNAWYDEEHLDILLKSPHWPMCRRFKVQAPQPGGWNRFVVDTPSSKATDLGCRYTLTMQKDGTGLVTVETGWVAFQHDRNEAFKVGASQLCLRVADVTGLREIGRAHV